MVKEDESFRTPGRSKGLIEVVRKKYLLSLLVHKELRVRYRGSVLGMLWSYAKPTVQFLVFYFAIGIFMGMNRNVENFVVYMFSGIVVINYFSEVFGNATKSVIWNAPLVKKIYLPGQLFPVASAWVAFVHFFPQLIVLCLGALATGWRPGLFELVVFVYAFIVLTFIALGLGLMAGAFNVFVRDIENFVDLLLMIVTWATPVLYKWDMVQEAFGSGTLWYVYQLNPLTPVVELFHYVFWAPTLSEEVAATARAVPPNMYMWAGVAGLMSVALLILGDAVFRKLSPRFAQEL